MAIPKKGSRTITVDDVEYRWRTDYDCVYDDDGLNTQTRLIFTTIDGRSLCSLVFAGKAYFPPQYRMKYADYVPVIPGLVAKVIRAAISAGWPTKKVALDHLTFREHVLAEIGPRDRAPDPPSQVFMGKKVDE